MKNVFFIFLQCTWGVLQSLLGVIFLLINVFRIRRIFIYKNSVVIGFGRNWGGVSLGLFIFVSKNRVDDIQTLLHEYGHCIQSVILGPLYVFVIGIPSLSWAMFFSRGKNYYSFYTERWANKLVGLEY